jgi:predicted kinase
MLIIFSGLPGAGKSTIAKALTAKRRAAYVRVDDIEQALLRCGGMDVGAKGYIIAHAVALSNLKLGLDVVADSVNPVEDSRQGWRNVAKQSERPFLEVEIVCTDLNEHRRRVENRTAEIIGHELPSWATIQAYDYTSWTTDRLVVDTAQLSIGKAIESIEAQLDPSAGSG